MNDQNPYAAPQAKVEDVEALPTTGTSGPERAFISLTIAELQKMEAMMLARIKKSAPLLWLSQNSAQVALFMILIATFFLWQKNPGFYHMLLLAGILLYIGAIVVFKQSYRRIIYADGSKVLRPFILEITAAGLLALGEGRRETPWTGIEGIVETPELSLILLMPNYAFVVPARCFANLADYQAFIANVRTGVEKHGIAGAAA